ncbi:MAG TPA: hypothetical protein VIK91_00740, partial [Nannocystis sp.]
GARREEVERAGGDAVARFVAQARGLAGDVETGPLTNGTHYFASNERDLDLVASAVQDLCGVVVAVGADPGYLLAAWADAEALVLIDLDPAIVRLHHIYRAFFAAAEGPEAFRRLWSTAGRDEARAIVGASGQDGEAEALLEVFEAAQPAVERRLAELERRMAAAGQAWLLSDPRLYARVAGLVRAGKVIALRGDFTRAGVVHEVGTLLRAAGLRVGLLYLSNIEQYFLYTPGFRANVAALPLDGGQVLRTLPGRPAGFEYIFQQGGHFQTWAARPAVRSVYRIRGFKKGEHLTSRRVHVVDPMRAPPRAELFRRRGGPSIVRRGRRAPRLYGEAADGRAGPAGSFGHPGARALGEVAGLELLVVALELLAERAQQDQVAEVLHLGDGEDELLVAELGHEVGVRRVQDGELELVAERELVDHLQGEGFEAVQARRIGRVQSRAGRVEAGGPTDRVGLGVEEDHEGEGAEDRKDSIAHASLLGRA